jgi:hypothetical protein
VLYLSQMLQPRWPILWYFNCWTASDLVTRRSLSVPTIEASLPPLNKIANFDIIRGHGIFDDDVSAYLNGEANLINIFSIFDFYLSVGIRPIMEVSFMPDELASDATKTISEICRIPTCLVGFSQHSLFPIVPCDPSDVQCITRGHFAAAKRPTGMGFIYFHSYARSR